MSINGLKLKLVPRHYTGTPKNGILLEQTSTPSTNLNTTDPRESLIDKLEDSKMSKLGSSFRQNSWNNLIRNGRYVKDDTWHSNGFMIHENPGDTLWNYRVLYTDKLKGSGVHEQEDYTVQVKDGKYSYLKLKNGKTIEGSENLQRNEIPESIRNMMQPSYNYNWVKESKWTQPFYDAIKNSQK